MSREPKFWSTWKGRIIRAIVVDGEYERNKILKTTALKEEQFKTALSELFGDNLLKEMAEDRLWVNSVELCNEYRSYFEEIQANLVSWVNKWMEEEGADAKPNHFFLEDRLLSEFSEKLIDQANVGVLIVNPYVEQCHISNALMSASKRGASVRLLTRSIDKQYQNEKKKQYHSKLIQKGVSITYDESVHAKLIVVDKAVATISSLNFIATSSGGASWEAGLVTVEQNVVKSVYHAITNRL